MLVRTEYKRGNSLWATYNKTIVTLKEKISMDCKEKTIPSKYKNPQNIRKTSSL